MGATLLSFSILLSLNPASQMDQRPYPGPSPLFHFRMSSLFVILWMTDFLMFLIAVENTISNGVGGMVLFASEVSYNRQAVTESRSQCSVWHFDG